MIYLISVFLTSYICFLDVLYRSNIYFAAFCISFHDVKYLFSWLVLSVFLTCYVCFLICYICSLDVWCHVCWSVLFTIINHTCRYNRFWFFLLHIKMNAVFDKSNHMLLICNCFPSAFVLEICVGWFNIVFFVSFVFP